MVKQQLENKQLKNEKKKNLEEIKQLTDKLSIHKHELRVLGKRPFQREPEEDAELQLAIANEIKRRRKDTSKMEKPVTLKERRAADRATIEKLVKANKTLLVPWQDIIVNCLHGKKPQPFLRL